MATAEIILTQKTAMKLIFRCEREFLIENYLIRIGWIAVDFFYFTKVKQTKSLIGASLVKVLNFI